MREVIAACSPWLVLIALALSWNATAARLTADDKKLLDGLITAGVTDPAGKAPVRVARTNRSVWGDAEEVPAPGWLLSAKEGEPARVFFLDRGDWIPAPQKPEPFDFVGECRKLAANKQKLDEGNAAGPDERDARFLRMSQIAGRVPTPLPPLIRAAWLYRLGEDELAEAQLAEVKAQIAPNRDDGKPQPPDEALHAQLAWEAFSAGVNAYVVRADEEALRQAERLNTLYPSFATKFGPGEELLADLKRRQKAGTFNHAAPPLPVDLAQWPPPKRVAWLIDQLDQVDARQMGQPGGVPLGEDARVTALIAVGDDAVPALIDCIEKDTRLTRSVHFWRDFAQSRTIIAVREAALTAAMSILRTRVFEPAATGDNFTSRGEPGAKETAQVLRNIGAPTASYRSTSA
jgi:hypothetical protein